MSKKKFSYDSLSDLREAIEARNLEIPLREDVEPLTRPFRVKEKEVPNAFCANPMEGRDGKEDGGPGELTFRKYRRLAEGGAGIIWIEATAVNEEGKSHPRQLHLNEDSARGFKKLVRTIRENALDSRGDPRQPLVILQLTHSGRHSNPEGRPRPIIAHHSRVYDAPHEIDSDHSVISDEKLDELQGEFLTACELAQACGFDGVDVKACHGYLIHELLFSYRRDDSRYGGSFEDRTRFLCQLVEKIGKEFPDLLVTTRLNVYDGVARPWGWGTASEGELDRWGLVEHDLSEPAALIRKLKERGVELVNLGIGNPYYNPHLERPYDSPTAGGELPAQHPLELIAKNLEVTSELADQVSDVRLIGTGLSWLRQFYPYVASAMSEKGWIDSIGVGRGSLANPQFANHLLEKGKLAEDEVCITCSSCSQMMKDGVKVGCVVRDSQMYRPIYQKGREERG